MVHISLPVRLRSVKICLAVYSATWNAGYDIRVDMKTKDKPIALTYKGGIIQDTGEVRDHFHHPSLCCLSIYIYI